MSESQNFFGTPEELIKDWVRKSDPDIRGELMVRLEKLFQDANDDGLVFTNLDIVLVSACMLGIFLDDLLVDTVPRENKLAIWSALARQIHPPENFETEGEA